MPRMTYHLPDRRARQRADLADDLRDACRLRRLGFRIEGDEALILRSVAVLYRGALADATAWLQETREAVQ